MVSSFIEYEKIDERLRRTIKYMRDNGFNTIKSGFVGASPFIKVITDPNVLLSESRYMVIKLLEAGLDVKPYDTAMYAPKVKATYDPVTRESVIWIGGVEDKLLPKSVI